MSTVAPPAEPLLRTLAPALRRLEQQMRGWLDTPRRRSLSTLQQAALDGLSTDLQRQSTALDVDRPLLVIMFMGGTGVGKSSLLNALARAPVAQAAFTRPTTRDPIVYYHESIRPERLDKAFHQCRLVAHDHPGLEQKILVDTPDLDSNEEANREKLKHLLPLADVVLYVGSQEKYHDQLGWELFLEQRRRRAFAFVLNKWDRCLHGLSDRGLRPDDDLLKDLRDEGFEQPLLFRTCAQAWIESNGQPPKELPEGEQFRDLEHWLEMGLTRLEIEAIKARGVSQLLQQLEQTLESAKPPELQEIATQTQKLWEKELEDESGSMADALLLTIEPHQREIEQHFALEGHRRFRGVMAWFLNLVNKIRFFGSSLRRSLPVPLRTDLKQAAANVSLWDLTALSKACSSLASDRHLDARGRALPNHLLVKADQAGFPVALLNDATENAAKLDWRQRFAHVLLEVLHEVESAWTQPTGARRGLQRLLILLGDVVPVFALLGSAVFLMYSTFWSGDKREFSLSEWLLLPFATVFLSLIIMYVIIALVLPIRWPAIRGAFHRQLTKRIHETLAAAYSSLPKEVADALAAERKQIDQVLTECREVADWLRQRELAASIGALYGSTA